MVYPVPPLLQLLQVRRCLHDCNRVLGIVQTYEYTNKGRNMHILIQASRLPGLAFGGWKVGLGLQESGCIGSKVSGIVFGRRRQCS